MDNVAYDLMTSMTPTVEELKACGDVLECFKNTFGVSTRQTNTAEPANISYWKTPTTCSPST